MSDKTIREIVRELQNEILNTDLQPERAAEILNKLSALMGNVLDQITNSDMSYNAVLMSAYKAETKANRAKILAENSEEYRQKREAKDTKELLDSLISSLKYFLRGKENEYKSVRFQ